MEQSLSKTIVLTLEQLRMAHSILRSTEFKCKDFPAAHTSLRGKLETAQWACMRKPALPVACSFTEDEKLLMRSYNQDYCVKLTSHCADMEEQGLPDLLWLEAYRIATQVQLLFSSIH